MILIYKKSHMSRRLVIMKRLKIKGASRHMAKNDQVTDARPAWTHGEQSYLVLCDTVLLEGSRGH